VKPKAPKHKRVRPSGKSEFHLDMIRALPCILSGRPAEAAHIRYADASHNKPETGAGRKPDDVWCLPLAPELHRLNKGCQHDAGDEKAWWHGFGIDPLAVCQRLWGKNRIQMERVIIMHQPWDPAIKAKIAEILRGKA
jgi:hypothetical protein